MIGRLIPAGTGFEHRKKCDKVVATNIELDAALSAAFSAADESSVE